MTGRGVLTTTHQRMDVILGAYILTLNHNRPYISDTFEGKVSIMRVNYKQGNKTQNFRTITVPETRQQNTEPSNNRCNRNKSNKTLTFEQSLYPKVLNERFIQPQK
jgi:hypothetical protein